MGLRSVHFTFLVCVSAQARWVPPDGPRHSAYGRLLQRKDKSLFGQTVLFLPLKSSAKRCPRHNSRGPASLMNAGYLALQWVSIKGFFSVNGRPLKDLPGVRSLHPSSERQWVPNSGWPDPKGLLHFWALNWARVLKRAWQCRGE